ncbi:MAG: hypothetical protein JRD68_06615 [Deltaproteobacteria bacterium]|nr:hypothetical protein [Deltaproteobacteria bacterium]
MAKRGKKPLKKVAPEMRAGIEEAATSLFQKLPTDDPMALFEDVTDGLGGYGPEVIDRLAGEKTVEVINYLFQLREALTDKAVLKTVRKAIYRLEQAGIEPEADLKNRGSSFFRPPEPRPSLGYISVYDRPDFRYGMLCVPAQLKGLNVCSFVISQSQGFKECDSYHMTESTLKGFVEKLISQEENLLYEVPPEHIRFILQEAATRTFDLGLPLPPDYEEFQHLSQKVSLPDEHMVYRMVDTDQLAAGVNLKNMASRLLEHKFLASWILIEELQPYHQKFSEIENSVLILNEAQKAEQRMAVYEQAEKELFTPEQTAFLKRRLEETALLFLEEGEVELAEGALALGLDLAGEAGSLRRPIFIQTLVARSFEMSAEVNGNRDIPEGMVRDSKSGLILPAGARGSEEEHNR